MTEPRIERLIAAMERDLEILDRLVLRMQDAQRRIPWPAEDPTLYLVAVTLDHYYSAYEAMAERALRFFEGLPERSERWHKELLEATALALRGVRPALVSPEVYGGLRLLLEFRHFMRHAYGVELASERLANWVAG
jgi:hypothetical protein